MKNFDISRKNILLEKLIIVDGQPGCGKSMMSPIISSFKNVEKLSFSFEMEYISRLYKFKKITEDASISLFKLFVDLKLYEQMMGRNVNFRETDVSSIHNYPFYNKYIKRIMQPGDEVIPDRIQKEKPIMHLTTHDMFLHAELLFKTFKKKLIFIEVLRHPLYMLIQQSLNFDRIFGNIRDINIYYNYNNKEYPYFARSWEKEYSKLNSVEKAIRTIQFHTKINDSIRKKIKPIYSKNIITIPFERFVLRPDLFLQNIIKYTGTSYSSLSKKIIKSQNIPRKKIADGIDLAIYKRCGWQPSKKNLNERQELDLRRDYAIKNNVSKKYLKILDQLSADYEKKYMKEFF